MISQTVEYALRAVVTLAQNDGRACTARELAALTQVPGPYLSKLMQGLVRGGIVRSQRGLHGGFSLAREVQELSLWDVIEVVEPIQRIHECPLDIQSHGTSLCPLHRRLDSALESIESIFRETTLAELLAEEESVTPLCEKRDLVKLAITPKPNGRSKREPSKR